MITSTIPGELFDVSIVIGVCGSNFCTLVADTQKIVFGTDGEPTDAGTIDKIMKVNNKVVFGTAGLFSGGEMPFDVVLSCDNLETASAKVLHRHIVDSVKHNRCGPVVMRSYIVGGKDRDGRFSLYDFRWDAQKEKFIERKQTPNDGQFAISVALPPSLYHLADIVVNAVELCIKDNRVHADVVRGLEGIIRSVSKMDKSINDKPMTVSVF